MLRVLTVTVLGVFVLLYAGFGRSPLFYLESLRRLMSGHDYSSAFQGIVPFDSVLVSAADRPAGLVKDTCLMVVVRLAQDAPPTPPKQTRSLDGRFEFGGRWRETPERIKLAAAPDHLETCSHLADPELLLYLHDALGQPGNFVIRNWREGVLQIYAPTVGLAAYMSFGPSPFGAPNPPLPRTP